MSIDIGTDDGFRAALTRIAAAPEEPHAEIWQRIGAQVLDRAERDAQTRPRHVEDYVGAYVLAALETVKRRPQLLLRAGSPWALLVVISRRKAVEAVASSASGGLTGRDPVTHRARACTLPRTVSLDALRDASGFDLEPLRRDRR